LFTKPGVTAVRRHMVVGYYFVTRWIWIKYIEKNRLQMDKQIIYLFWFYTYAD